MITFNAGAWRFNYRVDGVIVRDGHVPEDFDASFEILSRERPDFLIVQPSPVIFRHRQRVAEFAVRHRLPTGIGARGRGDGGRVTPAIVRADVADLLRRGAGVDRILKGARPASLPVEQPTRFELVVNRRVARAIGLELTQALLAQADEVID